MPRNVDVRTPDGWICEIEHDGNGAYAPRRWKRSIGNAARELPDDISPGLQQLTFPSAEEAMTAAYRERLQRNIHRRRKQN